MKANLSFGKKIAVLALAVATAVTSMTVDWNNLLSVGATTSGTLSLSPDESANQVAMGQTFTQTINAPSAGANQSQKLSELKMMFGAAEGETVNADVSVALYKNTFSADPAALVYSGNKNISFTAGTDGGYTFPVFDASSGNIELVGSEPLYAVVTVSSLSTANEGTIVHFGTDEGGRAMVYTFDDVVNLEEELPDEGVNGEAPEEEQAGSEGLSNLFGDDFGLSAENDELDETADDADLDDIPDEADLLGEEEAGEENTTAEAVTPESAEENDESTDLETAETPAQEQTAEETQPAEQTAEDAVPTDEQNAEEAAPAESTQPAQQEAATENETAEETVEETSEEVAEDATAEEQVEETPEEEPEEEIEEPEAGELSAVVGVVRAIVRYDAGVFPNGCSVSVRPVAGSEKASVENAVDRVRSNEKKVVTSYTYDITVYDKDGQEIQPDTSKGRVTVSFAIAQAANHNLDAAVYHVEDNMSAEKLSSAVTTEGGAPAVIAATDGFSYYTVEFTYGNLQYVLPGDSGVALSEVLSTIGLSGTPSMVVVSDETKFMVQKENGIWMVRALRAFDTTEWMKVTIDGIVYEIVVTDDNPVRKNIRNVAYMELSATETPFVFGQNSQVTPSLTFKRKSDNAVMSLTQGVDYTVTYEGSATITRAGTYTVIADFSNSSEYSGNLDAQYTVTPIDFDNVNISLKAGSTDYFPYRAGVEQMPEYEVTYMGATLIEGTHYEVEVNPNKTSAGIKTVTFEGIPDFFSGANDSNQYEIVASMSSAIVYFSGGSQAAAFTSTGKEVTYNRTQSYNSILSTISRVKLGTKTLTSANDYTASIVLPNDGNGGVGTDAKILFTGKNHYLGDSFYVTFKVSPKDISGDTATVTKSGVIYDGTEKTIENSEFSLIDDGQALENGTDCKITSYIDNVNAGTATVTISGIGNYTGSETATFSIAKLDVTTCSVEFADKDAGTHDYYFTGSAIEPTIILKDGSGTVIPATDYNVAYSNNTAIADDTAGSPPTVTVTPKTSGTINLKKGGEGETTDKTATFSILPFGRVGLSITFDGESYTVLPGTDGSYNPAGSIETTCEKGYNAGNAITPSIVVRHGETTLTEGTHYTVSFTNNTSVGTATATITGKDGSAYAGKLSVDLTFAITRCVIGTDGTKADNTTVNTNASGEVSSVTYDYDGDGGNAPVTLTLNADYEIYRIGDTDSGASVTRPYIKGIGNYTGTINLGSGLSADCFVKVIRTYVSGGLVYSEALNKRDGESFSTLYMGQNGKPAMTLYKGNPAADSPTWTVLTEGIHYTVSMDNNSNNAGSTRTITFTAKPGQSACHGSVSLSYTIQAIPVGDLTEAAIQSKFDAYPTAAGSALAENVKTATYSYTGGRITPIEKIVYKPGELATNAVVRIDADGELNEVLFNNANGSDDYDFLVTTPDEAVGHNYVGPQVGSYTGAITFKDANFSNGSTSHLVNTCTVQALELNVDTVYMRTGSSTYTKLSEATVTAPFSGTDYASSLETYVKDLYYKDAQNTYALTAGSDYRLEAHTDNPSIVNAGTYKYNLKPGTGSSYTVNPDPITYENFTVSKKSIDTDTTVTVTTDTFNYTGNAIDLTTGAGIVVKDKDSGTTLATPADYTLDAVSGTNPGEYDITITGAGNYDTATTKTVHVYIKVNFSDASKTFTVKNHQNGVGEAVTPINPSATGYTVGANAAGGPMDEHWVAALNNPYTEFDGLALGSDFYITYNDEENQPTRPGMVEIKLNAYPTSKKCTGSCTVGTTAFYGDMSQATVTGPNGGALPTWIAKLKTDALMKAELEDELTVKYGNITLNDSEYNIAYAPLNNWEAGTTVNFTVGGTETRFYRGNSTASAVKVLYDLSRTEISVGFTDNNDANWHEYTGDCIATNDASNPMSVVVSYTPTGETLTAGDDFFYGKTSSQQQTLVQHVANNISARTQAYEVYVCAAPLGTPVSAGTNHGNYYIRGIDMDSCTVTLEYTSHVYTGSDLEPTVTVSYHGSNLDPSAYTVSYSDNKNVAYEADGTTQKANAAVVTVTGKGQYQGTKTATFTITPKAIDSGDVVANLDSTNLNYPYAGDDPAYSLTVADTAVAAGVDIGSSNYTATVVKTDGTSSGIPWHLGDQGKIKVTGKGNYTGTLLSSTFTIVKANINEVAEVSSTGSTRSAVYTGADIDAAAGIVVTLKDKVDGEGNPITLTRSTDGGTTGDYVVEYQSGTTMRNAGNYTVYIRGINNYQNSLAPFIFTITPKPLTATDMSVTLTDEGAPAYAWNNGAAVQPHVKVVDGHASMGSGHEETLFDANASNAFFTLEADENQDSGEHTLTVTAVAGNYTGSVDLDFTIGENLGTVAEIVSITPEAGAGQKDYYDGQVKYPTVAAKKHQATQNLTEDSDYTVDYDDLVNVGNHAITLTGTGGFYGTLTSAADAYTIWARPRERANTEFTITPHDGGGLSTRMYTGSISVDALNQAYPGLLFQGTDNNYYYYYTTYTGEALQPTFDVEATITYSDHTTYTETVATNKTASGYDPAYAAARAVDNPAKAFINLKDVDGNNYSANYEPWSAEDTVTVYYAILPYDGELVLSAEDVEYAGGNIVTPSITVTDTAGHDLQANTDYQLTFMDADGYEISASAITDVEEYFVTATGIGDYSGLTSNEDNFYVYAKIDTTADYCTITVENSDDTQDPDVTVRIGDDTLIYATDYTFSAVHPYGTTPGTVRVWSNNVNLYHTNQEHNTVSYYGTSQVPENQDMANATVAAIPDQQYTGSPITPALTVTLDGNALTAGTDYSAEYANNTELGTATVTLTGIYPKAGTKTVTFNITETGSGGGDDPSGGGESGGGSSGGGESGGGSGGGSSGGGSSSGGSSSGGGIFPWASILSGGSSTTASTTESSVSDTPVRGSVKLKWKNNTKYDGYVIYRSTKKNGTYKKIATVSSKKSSYTNDNLKSGKSYYYYLKAFKKLNGKTVYSKRSKISKVTVE